MSFASLYVGYTALNAAQRSVEVAAHNVANAGTAGYTRQRLAVQTAPPTSGTAGLRGDGMRGTGVSVMSIDRLRDQLADTSWRSEAGLEGAASSRADALTRTEGVLGAYASGAPEALSAFMVAWDGLSRSPDSSAARMTVLSGGAALATSLRESAQGLSAVSGELSTRIGDRVGELNGLLAHVADLNGAIQRAVVDGGDPNDLYDARDTALDRLTQLTGATVTRGDREAVDVSLGGTSLVKGITATSLQPQGEGQDLVLTSADGDPVVAGGLLGGDLSVLKVDIPDYRARLDTLAQAVRDTANAVHTRGTDLNGGPGGDFFTGEGAADLTLRPGLDEDGVVAAVNGNRLDGEGALAMSAALRTSLAVGTQTLASALRGFSAKVGQAVTDATRGADSAKQGMAAVTLARTSANGVNVDEEMVDLVKYQHSYSAASRVITIVDEMLDQIINKMGA